MSSTLTDEETEPQTGPVTHPQQFLSSRSRFGIEISLCTNLLLTDQPFETHRELGLALSEVPNEQGLEKLLSSDSHVSGTAAE